jgi:molybdopterin-guanine dinucleotide biosynthesis protein A
MPLDMSELALSVSEEPGGASPERRPHLPAAVVLAGGRSTRIGGGDKSLLLLGGRPLVEHVLARLRPQAAAVAINANGDPARFERYRLPVLTDTVGGHRGPLAGLLAGMEWASALGASHLVTVPTDSPFIPADLVARLSGSGAEPGRPALAASGGRTHPVAGLWPVVLAGSLRDFLAVGETNKVSVFAERCGAVAVDFPLVRLAGRDVDPFFSVNTPADLACAEALLEDARS